MNLSYRLFRLSDIPALVEVLNASHRYAGKSEQGSAERLQYMAAAPHLRAEENFTVVLDEAGVPVGSVIFMMRPDSGMSFGDIVLHPDNRDSAIVAELIQRCETRILQRAGDEVPAGVPVSLTFGVDEGKKYLRPVLESHGYREQFRQYVMQIALDKTVSKPDFPPEFVFRPFDIARDGGAVHAVFQECFADHAGDVAKIPYEQWSHQFNAPDFDASIWYMLYQGDDIAAICLCEIKDETTGVVEVLGVRPAFRKRGLGGLLLRHAFYAFQQRDFKQVILDVDADNSTNAVALYENAGMNVQSRTDHYSKVLRK